MPELERKFVSEMLNKAHGRRWTVDARLSYCGAFRTQLVPTSAPNLQQERNLARFARQIALGAAVWALTLALAAL